MLSRLLPPCVCFLLLSVGLMQARAQTTRGAEALPPVANGEWSEASKGVSGRLAATVGQMCGPTQVLGLCLELRTHATTPRALLTGPGVAAVEVLDADGKPLAQKLDMPRSGPVPAPQWAIVPFGTQLSFHLDCTTAGVRPILGGAVLDVQSRFWELPPGRYTIKATYQCPAPPPEELSSKSEAWTGKIVMTLDVAVPLR